MNVTGLVKYVGKVGSGGGSMFVGLKLDQPGKEAIFYTHLYSNYPIVSITFINF